MAKNELDLTLVIIVVAGLYLILNPGILQGTITVNVPGGGGSTSTTTNTYSETTIVNERAPTSLTMAFNRYDFTMGETAVGYVTGNGYNYPVTVYVKHVGSGDQVSESGLLAADGRFLEARAVHVPGVYEVWATSNGVTSNTVTLGVHGCLVLVSPSQVLKGVGSQKVDVRIFGDPGRAVTAMVNDPAHSMSYPWPSLVSTNMGGYATTSYDFAGLALGNYEVDAIVNGYKASTYGASAWVEVA